jgi:hypothetical protein
MRLTRLQEKERAKAKVVKSSKVSKMMRDHSLTANSDDCFLRCDYLTCSDCL